MKASTIKGAFLEYIIRRIFIKCGFRIVKPDDIFIFEKSPLTFVNGKGAAHDADVLMDPPMQIPFLWPSRIIFECKNYKDSLGLGIVRNALGVRTDLNEFEIVTKDFLEDRKNNRRSSLAIDSRIRHQYQVGVASVDGFSKPAIEFATHHKIPLFSLSWLIGQRTIDSIKSLNNDDLVGLSEPDLKNLFEFCKDQEAAINGGELDDAPKTVEI